MLTECRRTSLGESDISFFKVRPANVALRAQESRISFHNSWAISRRAIMYTSACCLFQYVFCRWGRKAAATRGAPAAIDRGVPLSGVRGSLGLTRAVIHSFPATTVLGTSTTSQGKHQRIGAELAKRHKDQGLPRQNRPHPHQLRRPLSQLTSPLLKIRVIRIKQQLFPLRCTLRTQQSARSTSASRSSYAYHDCPRAGPIH